MRTRDRILMLARRPRARGDAGIRVRRHDASFGRCAGAGCACAGHRCRRPRTAVQVDVPRPPGSIPRSGAGSRRCGLPSATLPRPRAPGSGGVRCTGCARARPSAAAADRIRGAGRSDHAVRGVPLRRARAARRAEGQGDQRRSNTPPNRAWSRRNGSSAACMRKATASSSPTSGRSSISAASPTATPTTIRAGRRRATSRMPSCRSATTIARASRIRDVKADLGRARHMYAYAASYFGDPDAQYHLARLLLDGSGAEQRSAAGRALAALGGEQGPVSGAGACSAACCSRARTTCRASRRAG